MIFRQKVVDKIADSIIFALTSFAAPLIGGGLYSFEVIHDPFYHDGWLALHQAWVILFIVVFFVASALCLWLGGLLLVTTVAIVLSIVFGVSYENTTQMAGSDQLAVWIIHWLLYSILPGVVAGWLLLILKRLGVL